MSSIKRWPWPIAQLGCSPDVVNNGSEALEAAHLNVILMDYQIGK